MTETRTHTENQAILAGSTILMVTGDLLFSSKVEALARRAGVVFEVVNAKQLASAKPADWTFALLDMTNMDAEQVEQAVNQLKELGAQRIAAFGRHDRLDLRAAAMKAGVFQWWPNSKMAREMQSLLGLRD